MTSQELADEVARVVADAQSRILTVGADQYTEPDGQKFESMPLANLVEYVREEALDLVNYGVMLSIRVERLKAAMAVAHREAWRKVVP
jgi:hypothetical protein